MKLSIIIPYHNEGESFIKETIRQILNTIDFDQYEIIVVDDCSTKPLSLDNVKVIRHSENRGVGAAFDTGAAHASSENLMLIGSDIRFTKNQWASKLVSEIEAHPKAFTATTCVALKPDDQDIEKRRNINTHTGATILLFHDKKSNPVKSESFRSIIEARWLPKIKNRDIDSFEIPCILGAAYGVKKKWYQYCDGFALHKKWGTLEPYISMKSWMFGGSCRVAPRVEIGHIFRTASIHNIAYETLIYNKLMVARLLISDFQRFFNYLGGNEIVDKGRKMYIEKYPEIIKKANEYKTKKVMSSMEFAKKFGIDYRM